MVIRVGRPFFITVIYDVIYLMGRWQSLLFLLNMVTLYSNLFNIINEGLIAIQTSTKFITSNCGFQRVMVTIDPLFNFGIPWFIISKVLNGGA